MAGPMPNRSRPNPLSKRRWNSKPLLRKNSLNPPPSLWQRQPNPNADLPLKEPKHANPPNQQTALRPNAPKQRQSLPSLGSKNLLLKQNLSGLKLRESPFGPKSESFQRKPNAILPK